MPRTAEEARGERDEKCNVVRPQDHMQKKGKVQGGRRRRGEKTARQEVKRGEERQSRNRGEMRPPGKEARKERGKERQGRQGAH